MIIMIPMMMVVTMTMMVMMKRQLLWGFVFTVEQLRDMATLHR